MYRIADFNVNIRYMYPENRELFSGYETDGNAKEDFFIASTDKEIDDEIKACLEFDASNRHSPRHAERLVILRKLCAMLIARNTFLLHGVALEYKGEGFIFSAPSGTGKSTHAMLWKKAFGDEARIINGDKPLVRLLDGKFYAYGTPWCGKENLNINDRMPVSAICFLERAAENRIERIDETEALRRLLGQIDVGGTADFERLFGLACGLVEACPVYKLYCNMDISAAAVAYEGMKKKA